MKYITHAVLLMYLYSQYNHICDNITLVGEIFQFLERREDTFTESQQYIMRFNNNTSGERQCDKVADLLNSSIRYIRQYESTLHANNCGSPERILGCTLNLEGLKWVRRHKFNYGAHLVHT